MVSIGPFAAFDRVEGGEDAGVDGRFVADWVFPYPQLAADERDEVQQAVARLERFCDQHLDPVRIDREADIPREVIDGLGEHGGLRGRGLHRLLHDAVRRGVDRRARIARAGLEVELGCRTRAQAERIAESGTNGDRLPGIELPERVGDLLGAGPPTEFDRDDLADLARIRAG